MTEAPVSETHVHQAGRHQKSAAYVIDWWLKAGIALAVFAAFLLAAWVFDWEIPLPEIRTEDWLAAIAPAILIPWMWGFAWAGSRFLVHLQGPTSMAVWKVHKKARLSIEGEPVYLSSKTSDAKFVVVTDFDPETMACDMRQFEGRTQLDAIRDLSMIERFSRELTMMSEEAMHNRILVAYSAQKQVARFSEDHVALSQGMLDSGSDLLKELGMSRVTLEEHASIQAGDLLPMELGGEDHDA